MVTIPRVVLETNKLDWNHKDYIFLTVKEINGQKGLFLWKKQNKRSRAIDFESKI